MELPPSLQESEAQGRSGEETVRKPADPHNDYSDEALAERIAQQDVVAFTLIYDRYAPAVYALAFHLAGPANAEEEVQEIFLRLWARSGQFDSGRGSFRSWFMALARHHLLDQLERRGREQRMRAAEEVDALLADMADPQIDVAQEVWLRERRETILQGLRRLPPEQRRAIVLAYFGGLSQSSIAEELGWPLGTVKKRIRLGLQKLRTFFVHRDEPR